MMPSHTLQNCQILVVEDEYILADDLRSALEEAGAVVLGPVGHLKSALALITAQEQIDGAVLDVNLNGEKVFAAADRLMERQVPIVFTTGYDQAAIPTRYSQITRCEKPVDIALLARSIGKLIHA